MLGLLVLIRQWRTEPPSASSPAPPLSAGLHRVVRVVDGDTLILAPHNIVRLIGVNSPESVKPDHPVEPFGPEAAEFTRRFVARGAVHLTFDVEHHDRFGRILAYVWVGDSLLNEELLRVGLARFEPHFRYSGKMKDRFRRAQHEAREAGIGVWMPHPEGAGRRVRPAHDPLRMRALAFESAILPGVATVFTLRRQRIRFRLGDASWQSNRFPTVTTPPRPT